MRTRPPRSDDDPLHRSLEAAKQELDARIEKLKAARYNIERIEKNLLDEETTAIELYTVKDGD